MWIKFGLPVLKCYYQPAGPLISPHVLQPVGAAPPQPSQHVNLSIVGTNSKQTSTPLDTDSDRSSLQPLPSSTSTVESSDSDVLITGGDLASFRYPAQQGIQQSGNVASQQHSQQHQQQQLHQQAAAAAAAAAHQGPPYPRSMHQMHYTSAYPPNYYSPYPGEAMCYSPPYQPYFPAKVYQSAPPPPSYRRYPPYYQPGPPPPSEIYEQSPPSGGQLPPSGPPSGTQLVSAGPVATHTQHLEHYPGPPGYYPGYSTGGGGQCYTRSPYMEYPPQCPCPMQQSCPKNVHTGPHIGSNASSGSSTTSSSTNKNSISSAITTNSINSHNLIISTTASMAPGASPVIVTSVDSAISKTCVISSSKTNNILPMSVMHNSSNQQLLNISRGPVTNITNNTIHQKQQQLMLTERSVALESTNVNAHHHFVHHHPHLHHHLLQPCEEIQLLKPLKSELKSEHVDGDSKGSQYEEDVIQPPTPPLSFEKPTEDGMLAEKKLENTIGENSQSNCVVESFDLTISAASNTSIPLIVGRKARIGKTMAREMVYAGAAAKNNPVRLQPLQTPSVLFAQQSSQQQHIKDPLVPLNLPSQITNNKSNVEKKCNATLVLETQIKSEQIKKEREEDLLILLPPINKGREQLNKIKTEPDAVIHNDVEITSPASDGPKQRIKILEFHKNQCKKSPPNSYKSLIKQAEPKSYLCLSRKIEKRNRFGKFNKKSSGSSIVRKRHLILTHQQRQSLRLRKEQLDAIEKRKENIKEKRRIKAITKRFKRRQTAKNDRWTQSLLKQNDRTELESTDIASRGYFSEPETRCSSLCPTNGRKTQKSKTAEARSKSETKRPSASLTKREGWEYSVSPSTKANKSMALGVEKSKAPRKCKVNTASRKGNKATADYIIKSVPNVENYIFSALNKYEHIVQNRLVDVTLGPIVDNNNSSEANNNDCTKIPTDATGSEIFSEPQTENNTSQSSNVATLSVPDLSPPEYVFLQPQVPKLLRHHGSMKRIRSRSKFGCRKRQKHKHSISIEVDETIQPTRSDVVPKWNNGWRWEGGPFQGAVFLNSDDPHVIRTCYPAMRHSEGDIIRPRDCVLLKANEDNELPYVAKVAHLWENPEDGEMMMSLLWYYRPEHTEQGRQRNDCPDEVYASRHRDHNSVACIEDKCYVLTFREYCRYRRRLRAAEEDIQDVSIVPKRPNSFNPREVPENTNPELVMFCRRAYEFRQKRLLKMPNKHDNVTRSSN